MQLTAIRRMLKAIDDVFLNSKFEEDVFKQYFLKGHPERDRMNFLSRSVPIYGTKDPVRYGTVELAIRRILDDDIEGSFAEVGVYRGHTSGFIHAIAPERKLFLFDTFEGFPSEDLEGKSDGRFADTNLEIVKKNIGDLRNVQIVKGYFPDTAKGLEEEKFAFVMLDLDLYAPTMAGLEFFYQRMTPGGYMFLHDFNNCDPVFGVSKAVISFFEDKGECILELPDVWGSVVIRKNRG